MDELDNVIDWKGEEHVSEEKNVIVMLFDAQSQ